MVVGALFVALALVAAHPAGTQQLNISGEWPARVYEGHRVPGTELGDDTGLPINDAARQKASHWMPPSCLSLSAWRSRTRPPNRVAKPARLTISVAAVALLLAAGVPVGAPPPPRTAITPRALAPTEFTGYWAAVITEDWRFRMVTAPKSDTAGVPLNDAGMKAAAAWDTQKDAAAGDQRRALGAGGVMRMPVRLRVSWQDDSTLKLETDNGQQVRLFRFHAKETPPGEPQWQGHSIATWETVAEGQGLAPAGGGRGTGAASQLSGSLKVVTTRLRPGYVRRNGVP